MKTYPTMNAKIVDLLKMKDDPTSLYAAARIEELERRVKRAEKLERACKLVEDATDNCPLGLERDIDYDYCLEHCENSFVECWKKYFLEGDSDA